MVSQWIFLQLREKLRVKRCKMHISLCYKQMTRRKVCALGGSGKRTSPRQKQKTKNKNQGPLFFKSASCLAWTDVSAASGRSLAEVPAQSGRAVVRPELDEGVQEVSVQVGELLAGADLLQVVWGDHQEVTQGVECVEELQHQRNLNPEDTWDNVHLVNKVIFCI